MSWITCAIRHVSHQRTGWQRLMGSLIFIGHFPQKWSISSGSFVENNLQLRGSYESWITCVYIEWPVSISILNDLYIDTRHSICTRRTYRTTSVYVYRMTCVYLYGITCVYLYLERLVSNCMYVSAVDADVIIQMCNVTKCVTWRIHMR